MNFEITLYRIKLNLGKKEIKERILNEMNAVAKEGNLYNYEQVKVIHLMEESFESLGLLTPTFKLKRFEVKKFFADVIKEIYKK